MSTRPMLGRSLSRTQVAFLTAFATSCRRSILEMTTNAQSGHPGGSLSCVDFLSVLYTGLISQTGDPVIVSNGHISPAVYAVFAELGYIPKDTVLTGFRKAGTPYEGHVSRDVPGVWYGTGPLGVGVSAASGFAWAQKYIEQQRATPQPSLNRKRGARVFALIGDGESQEGQVYELMHAAKKYALDNLIVFMDYNQVQLSSSVHTVMPYDPRAHFLAAGWHVRDVDGHDYRDIWKALGEAYAKKGSPVLLLGHTTMGKGVPFMEVDGRAHKATWHGKAAQKEQCDQALHESLVVTEMERRLIETFVKTEVSWRPHTTTTSRASLSVQVRVGRPRVYPAGEKKDCRSAYGVALLDLAKNNTHVIALTADLAGSVKTDGVQHAIPAQHIDVGVAEQQMVSMAGGMSLAGAIPFCSTFGVFMTSRAKDQARVNDINETNVKMVATHCGLSVGEDGPTHQAIDDSGSMLGLHNTLQMEPADANQCDRMIRYAASHYGNMYIRMGRHPLPVLTKENGAVFFGADYEYVYGRCDVFRKGTDVTIVAMGGTVAESLDAWHTLKKQGIHAEIVIVSSIKQFDTTLFRSIKKTGHVLTVEDHNTHSGLGSQLSTVLRTKGIVPQAYTSLGVNAYQGSGTWHALYRLAKIDSRAIVKTVKRMQKK